MGKYLTHGPLGWHKYHVIVSLIKNNFNVYTARTYLFRHEFRRTFVLSLMSAPQYITQSLLHKDQNRN